LNEGNWRIVNPDGKRRVIVTRDLPGDRYVAILVSAGCRVEIFTGTGELSPDEIRRVMGSRCDGVIGQLVETWNESMFQALQKAGGRVYSNYAVGFNNIDLEAATRCGIAVGNTPGVLTEATAELAVALTCGPEIGSVGCRGCSWARSCGARPWGSSAPVASARPMPA
jgi:hydroxypyruvate reductase 1